MKKLSSIWFAASIFVLPCVLDIERIGVCLFLLADWYFAFRCFKKHNPEYVL